MTTKLPAWKHFSVLSEHFLERIPEISAQPLRTNLLTFVNHHRRSRNRVVDGVSSPVGTVPNDDVCRFCQGWKYDFQMAERLRGERLSHHGPAIRRYDVTRHWGHSALNTLRPRQNGRHFADDSFKRNFMNENVRISINISLKFVPKGLINNIPALVQIMAWRRPGDKPLSEPMMVNLLTHICVTRPQWVNGMGVVWHR